MTWDFRLFSDFLNHPKFRRLRRLHGSDGVVAVLALYGHAAEYKQSGVFTDMAPEDVLDAAGVETDRADFLDDLVEKCRLLDRLPDGTYAIHNWTERQPYIVNRDKISEQKKRAADMRWDKEKQKKPRRKPSKTKVSCGSEGDDAACNARALQVQCPIPSHPIPKKELSLLSLSREESIDGERVREQFSALVQEGQPGARLKNPEAWATMLQGLLDAGQSPEDLTRAMAWAMRDGFWRSRVLSARAFATNYSQIRIQMSDAAQAAALLAPPVSSKSLTV